MKFKVGDLVKFLEMSDGYPTNLKKRGYWSYS